MIVSWVNLSLTLLIKRESRYIYEMKCLFGMINFVNLIYYLVYFCYYLYVLLQFLVLFMGPNILFQLTFVFIYNIFNKKFLVLAK